MDNITILYDGEGYYTTIEDSSTVTDELIESYVYIPSITVSSKGYVRDLCDVSIIVNIIIIVYLRFVIKAWVKYNYYILLLMW